MKISSIWKMFALCILPPSCEGMNSRKTRKTPPGVGCPDSQDCYQRSDSLSPIADVVDTLNCASNTSHIVAEGNSTLNHELGSSARNEADEIKHDESLALTKEAQERENDASAIEKNKAREISRHDEKLKVMEAMLDDEEAKVGKATKMAKREESNAMAILEKEENALHGQVESSANRLQQQQEDTALASLKAYPILGFVVPRQDTEKHAPTETSKLRSTSKRDAVGTHNHGRMLRLRAAPFSLDGIRLQDDENASNYDVDATKNSADSARGARGDSEDEYDESVDYNQDPPKRHKAPKIGAVTVSTAGEGSTAAPFNNVEQREIEEAIKEASTCCNDVAECSTESNESPT